jgi:hypothetical protein
MQFFIDLGIAFIAAYLTFTNLLAEKILTIIPQEINVAVNESPHSMPILPSIFGEGGLTDILLKSSEYQKAAALEAFNVSQTVSDPQMAIVNIYCTFVTPTTIRTTTGTGFFIHSDGVIITNAHVAQYLLLGATNELGDAECLVRQGTPAVAKYKADLLYIPPTWVQKNAKMIDDAVPVGTGERDYSLLYVTRTIDSSPLPAQFPALAIETNNLPITIKGDTVTAAGYPATDLLKYGTGTPLLSVIATTTISELYTFGSNYADVFSIHGSGVGAEGSSGGPIINDEGKAIGVIVTKGDDEIDGKGSLRAITLSHINRTIKEETGYSLEKNINGNLAERSIIFTNTLAPFLISLLTKEIGRNNNAI